MNIRFDGETAIVTGAGHGLGREMARQLAVLGARVWGVDVNGPGLEETRRESGDRVQVALVDVRDEAAVESLVTRVAAETGRVDVLVNNAGGVQGQVGRPIEEVPTGDWQVIFDVNLTGAFLFSRAVTPVMKERGSGRIVNISSGAGLGVSLTGIQAYASAKAGLIGLTRQLAHELGRFGITVNCVAPGFVRSNPTTERQWESYGPEGQRALVESISLRRLGTPQDIAHAALFLASQYASWITGQTLSVNGGR